MDKNKIKSEKIALIVVIILFSGILSYGLIISKPTPAPVSVPDCPPTVTDIDGNVYNTVIIGSQCWMKENLKVTKDPQGKDITRYCYDNDPKICETDGGLYDWNTTMNGSVQEGAQGICPTGWHVPTNLEWHTLESGLATDHCSNGNGQLEWPLDFDCNPAGAKLKKNGSSGFEVISTGVSYPPSQAFQNRGYFTQLWTSTRLGGNSSWAHRVWYRQLYTSQSTVSRLLNIGNEGISLRCLKD